MKKFIVLAATSIAGASFGQGYSQPWTPGLSAWESAVYSCGDPTPTRIVAADDFAIELTRGIRRVNWWGVVSDNVQLSRPYYIAIYDSSLASRCRPEFRAPVWSGCVRPTAEMAGRDCKGNVVWKFFSNLPTPFFPNGGRSYWIQISESDKDSYKFGAPDFWWSAHQEIVKCPALQMDALGIVNQPLIDSCNQKPDDLAFELLP